MKLSDEEPKNVLDSSLVIVVAPPEAMIDSVEATDEEGRIPVRAPRLERYLEALDGDRRLLGAEARQRLDVLLHDPNALESRPQDRDHPLRILVLWRLARIMARICNLTGEDETLDATLSDLPVDPWSIGILPTTSQATINQIVRRPTLNRVIHKYLNPQSQTEFRNIPLLPNKLTAPLWCELVEIILDGTGMNYRPRADAGLYGMLDPHTAYHHAVTVKQILDLEELMVEEAQNIIIDQGERPAIRYFRDKHEFSHAEALGLIRLARAEAMRSAGSSVDENRAIMVHQLKDFITRSRASMNMDLELRALKELGKVQGLNQSEPEDVMREFLSIVGRVSTKQDQLQQNNTVEVRNLNAPDGDADGDEDDPNDLAAFDRENQYPARLRALE